MTTPDTSNRDGQHRIFFSGRYSYRKPSVLFASVVASLFGGFALRDLFMSIPHSTWSISTCAAVAFIGGIGSLLLVCGLFLLRQWFVQKDRLLEISTTGITYGETSHSWREIHWISGHRVQGGVHLFYQTRQRGLAGCDRPIPLDRNPTVEEYYNLLETLSSQLSEEHPHVEFG